MYYLYILKSLKDGEHYIGITDNVSKRVAEHNSGKTKSTKNRRPFILIYKEEHKSRITARERERYLKSYSGAKEKKELIEKYTKD